MQGNGWRGVAVGLACLWAGSGAAAAPIDAEQLRPGLVARFRDSTGREIMRLEPAVGLTLRAGEASHPRLAAEGGSAVWEGYLNVIRAGDYRFLAHLRGRLRVTVAGREVLTARVTTPQAQLCTGPAAALEEGVQPFRAEFTREPGAARVELRWQASFIRQEPVPFDVFGHLPARSPSRLTADGVAERGRFLAEEHACTACHRPTDGDRLAHGLASRRGPDLSQAGRRFFPGWLYRWLESPAHVRPSAAMPELFRRDDVGRVERYAVAAFLASLGGPARVDPHSPLHRRDAGSLARGERLYVSVGCVACHGRLDDKSPVPADNRPWSFVPPARRFPLVDLAAQSPPAEWAAYLRDPLAVDPSGRMPHLLLNEREGQDLARYLCHGSGELVGTDLPPPPPPGQVTSAIGRLGPGPEVAPQLSPRERLLELGRRLVVARGCTQCHTIAPGGKPLAPAPAAPAWDAIKQPAVLSRGCLADRRTAAPWFAFDAADRQALRHFLREAATGAGSPAPAYMVRTTFRRFNCLACHARDGDGGLPPALVEELRKYERADNAEAIAPPPLTGVGHKLRTPWLRQVLTQAGRARPWMGLRMPQFGEANVGGLPDALAAAEGEEPGGDAHPVALSGGKLDAGRRLVGKQAFGCISCHDIAGVPNTGTRGPDLASMGQRVCYDWYRRWLEQAQRMQPGTRMPTVFPDGRSPLADVLHGSADAQADAMWAYLSLGPGLPLPDGLEPPRGMVLPVKDRPALLRTFLPDVGTHALAVGFPGGVSVAFDAGQCRLAYAWSGSFLDAAPTWDGRGGNPAHPLGPRFWSAPPGCPLAISRSQRQPDFTARARDPAFGAPVDEGHIYAGPRRLAFVGYTVDRAGSPTFRYRLSADDAEPCAVTEEVRPLHSAIGSGVGRRFTVQVPAEASLWLRVAESAHEPRLLDAAGRSATLTWKDGTTDVAAAGHYLALAGHGDRPLVLHAVDAPPGVRWRLRHAGGTWQVLLHAAAAAPARAVRLAVDIWSPYSGDPALLKELIAVK